ncbi:MAG: Xaa-Pro dipeptidase [Candidatus Atribacteria bacterium]|nr:Xaa-Pro dipeptidase [Candidatus Atribacteria bacterium]
MGVFPEREFCLRLKRIREEMSRQGIDFLIVPYQGAENTFFYFVGYQPFGDATLLIPLDEEPFLFFSASWDRDRIEESTFVKRLEEADQPFLAACRYVKGRFKGVAGVADYWKLPYGLYDEGLKSLSLETQDATPCVKKVRLFHTEWEVGCYRRAVEIAERGMLRAAEILSQAPISGVSEFELAQEIQLAMDEEEFCGFSGVCLASSKRTAQPIAAPTQKKIEPGDLVVIDIGGVYRRYRSDICRTFVVGGEVRENQREWINAVKFVLETLLEEVKPGMRTRAIQRRAFQLFEEKALSQGFLHHIGHDLGFKPGELMNFERDDMELGEGMVFALEPALYFRGQGGVRIENNVLLTASGLVSLNQLPLLFS